jgi:hypothetical protein
MVIVIQNFDQNQARMHRSGAIVILSFSRILTIFGNFKIFENSKLQKFKTFDLQASTDFCRTEL